MTPTGERPTREDPSSAARSAARYRTALKFVAGRNAVDYGCGVGIGTAILASAATRVVGMDVSAEALEEARRECPWTWRSRCEFRTAGQPADLTAVLRDLGLPTVVVGLEVMEHIEPAGLPALLMAIREAGAAGYFSTPNGDLYPYHPATVAERRGFHTWHYTHAELSGGVFSMFDHVDVHGIERDPALGPAVFVGYGIFFQ